MKNYFSAVITHGHFCYECHSSWLSLSCRNKDKGGKLVFLTRARVSSSPWPYLSFLLALLVHPRFLPLLESSSSGPAPPYLIRNQPRSSQPVGKTERGKGKRMECPYHLQTPAEPDRPSVFRHRGTIFPSATSHACCMFGSEIWAKVGLIGVLGLICLLRS